MASLNLAAMLRTGQVAKMAGLHSNSVRKLCNEGILETIRIGKYGQRRIPRQSVEKYLFFASKQDNYIPKEKVLIYTRVSGAKQNKENNEGASDLSRQKERLIAYANQNYKGATLQFFNDISSGQNLERKGLSTIILCFVLHTLTASLEVAWPSSNSF
jgi:excisionase family DNA binding protein